MSLKEFIANLTEEDLKVIQEEFDKKNNTVKKYSFSNITFNELDTLLDIDKKITTNQFNHWFDFQVDISNETNNFLETLISKNISLIKDYSEEDLKINFIAPVLNHVEFKDFENDFRDYYELPLKYETEKFIFSGTTDFVVSKGLLKSKKPYFFIQEFKKNQTNGYPEPQLIAELISAIELNNEFSMKGAYIVGSIWNFVILEKLDTNKYQYFVSSNFDCTKIDDLKDIYKNLVFIKNEVITKIKKEI
jgi:hypothetical protein